MTKKKVNTYTIFRRDRSWILHDSCCPWRNERTRRRTRPWSSKVVMKRRDRLFSTRINISNHVYLVCVICTRVGKVDTKDFQMQLYVPGINVESAFLDLLSFFILHDIRQYSSYFCWFRIDTLYGIRAFESYRRAYVSVIIGPHIRAWVGPWLHIMNVREQKSCGNKNFSLQPADDE